MVGYISNHIRLAIISSVDHDAGVAYIRWIDQATDTGPRIPIPYPYAGPSGEGIFIGVRPGTIVAVDMTSYERYIPVAILPNTGNFGDISGTDEASFDNIGFPYLDEGEIVIQGITGSQLSFLKNGNVMFQNPMGEGKEIGGDPDDSFRCSIDVSTPVEYNVSHGGIKASGIVRRDVRIEDADENFANFLTGMDSEAILEEVGWDPSKRVSYITGASVSTGDGAADDKLFRNPALVENREVIYEFGRNWEVGLYDDELSRFRNDAIPQTNFDDRRSRRSNVLSLSLTYPNELMEKVSGTLVDIFGNILDINKNIIPSPSGKDEKELLDDIFEKMRHSVAFHMEINTRKGYSYREGFANTKKAIPFLDPPNPMYSANNARDRSRWAVRVDKEGLTSINIPATSETGNIPVLARYETSSVLEVDEQGNVQNKAREPYEARELFRNEKNKDIFLDQFGPGGITVEGTNIENRLKGAPSTWKDEENKQTTLPYFVEAGTAFHDITQTAKTILQKDINKNASDIFDSSTVSEDPQAISSFVNPQIPVAETAVATRDSETGLVQGQPNAGGRSAQINLDGSLELSLGANTVDRVAWTLDTAGAIVARLGRDRQGRSAIIQADGYVVLEVGGWDFIGEGSNDEVDTRFVGRGDKRKDALPSDPTRFRSGKIVIRLRRANPDKTGPDADGDDQLLIIDETGITIKTVGRLNLISDGDMTLQSGGQLILNGEVTRIYKNNSRFVTKSGRRMG